MTGFEPATLRQWPNTPLGKESSAGSLYEARLTSALGAENALRVGVASSMLVGLVVGRDIVQVPALSDADTEALVGSSRPHSRSS